MNGFDFTVRLGKYVTIAFGIMFLFFTISGIHSRYVRLTAIQAGVDPLAYVCLDRGIGYDREYELFCMELARKP